ncbi:hypothetical protein [Cloacibacillus evryensis]|uniref:hypothetical protein n=1 Tax=Cloacibacillus evryensis TaxID=508460 RepID=UPI002B1EA000|nr:hypothetical protein [Cloacibacillus evryensis]MEA5034217.1 hypothetical protein [Cloacibacillus evryensis]
MDEDQRKEAFRCLMELIRRFGKGTQSEFDCRVFSDAMRILLCHTEYMEGYPSMGIRIKETLERARYGLVTCDGLETEDNSERYTIDNAPFIAEIDAVLKDYSL